MTKRRPTRTHWQRWIDTQPPGTRTRLFRECGCSTATIHRLDRGIHLVRRDVAVAISAATGGAVTAVQLMGLES
jgi:hypothetical protein